MATLTKEQIEQKNQLKNGAIPLDDDELDAVVGGDRKVDERTLYQHEVADQNIRMSDWWGVIPDFAGTNRG